MSRHINAAAVLPHNAEQLRWAVQKALQACIKSAFVASETNLRDGDLSLLSMHKKGPLVIERREAIAALSFYRL